MTPKPRIFDGLAGYVYGAGDVGLPGHDYEHDRELIRIVAVNGNWLHASPDYGGAGNAGGTFRFLRKACDDLGVRPRMILKLFIEGYESGAPATTSDPVRNIRETLDVLGRDSVEIAQIWGSDRLYRDFGNGGPISETLDLLRDDGLVGRYAFQLTPEVTVEQWQTLQGSVVDGYMFYLNVIERNVSNQVYPLLVNSGAEIISLRALGRIFVDYDSWDSKTTPMPKYTHPDTPRRVEELKNSYERSGCRDWLGFNTAYRRALPNVVSTIGMTTRAQHLHAYLEADRITKPMAAELAGEISALQEVWYR